jgi:hypothetical protein
MSTQKQLLEEFRRERGAHVSMVYKAHGLSRQTYRRAIPPAEDFTPGDVVRIRTAAAPVARKLKRLCDRLDPPPVKLADQPAYAWHGRSVVADRRDHAAAALARREIARVRERLAGIAWHYQALSGIGR